MNYIVISPHFPSNFSLFCVRLAAQGVKVFGIDSEAYGSLSYDLKSSLTEYYKVDSLENYEQVLKAVAYFTHKYGKIDRIESHNEHWLELDAKLRLDFNVFGYKPQDLDIIQSKSKMKAIFIKQGIPVAAGIVVSNLQAALQFIEKVNYPVVAKPDRGVGASDTYKIKNEDELKHFFQIKPDCLYVMEAYVLGEIHTFDGLTDTSGQIVYSNSFIFPVGVMETVNDNLDMIYYSQKVIPQDLDGYGRKIVEAFKLKERFFHIEFFRTKEGDLVALEINVRPPGGYSMDIFNFSNDVNYYDEYAKVVVGRSVEVRHGNQHHCLYIGQKSNHDHAYLLSLDEVKRLYGSSLVFSGPIASIFSKAIGNFAYILKGEDLSVLKSMAQSILQKKAS